MHELNRFIGKGRFFSDINQAVEEMDDLREIYERIKLLRHNGVKMKEIAACTGFAPSVLSAVFTTVMPEYIKNLDKGMNRDEALDNALVWVNNVSKKNSSVRSAT